MKETTMENAVSSPNKPSIFKAFLAAGLAFVVYLFVTLVLIVFLGSVVGRYMQIFDAHGLSLPVITKQITFLSTLNNSYWYAFLIAFFVIDGPIAIGLQFLSDRMRWLKTIWFNSYLIAAIVFLFYSSVALLIPIQNLHESLLP